MNIIFGPNLDKFVLVFLEDILLYSKTQEGHIQHVKIILDLLRENKLFGKL